MKKFRKILATLMAFTMVFGTVPARADQTGATITITSDGYADPNTYINNDNKKQYSGIYNYDGTINEDEVYSIKTDDTGVSNSAVYGIKSSAAPNLTVGSLKGGITVENTMNDASSKSIGIQVGSADGTITVNSLGSITASGNGKVYGISAGGGAGAGLDMTVTFTGSDSFITAINTGTSGNETFGISVTGQAPNKASLTINSLGKITAKTDQAGNDGAIKGIFYGCVNGDSALNVTFTGTGSSIEATSAGTGNVYGIHMGQNSAGGTATVSNLDKIIVAATNASNASNIFGISNEGTATLNVALTGADRSITATNNGTGSFVSAYGVYLTKGTSYIGQYTDGGNTVGDGIKSIKATGKGSESDVAGIYSLSTGALNTTVTFSGSGSSITAENTGSDGYAYGIYANTSTGTVTTTVSNLGGMNVTGGYALGIYAYAGTTKVTFSGSGADDKVNIAGKNGPSRFLFAGKAAIVEITGDSSARTKVTFDGATSGKIQAISLSANTVAPTVKLTNMDITDSVLSNSDNYAIYASGTDSSKVSTLELTNTLLKGNVYLADANANLNLTMDSASTLTGNLDSNGGTLTFTNNGTWYPVFDSAATSSNKVTTFTLGETGVINMNEGLDSAGARDFRTLDITGTSFTSNGGTFAINTDLASGKGDLINLASVSTVTGTAKVKIAYDPCFETGASATGSYKFLQLPSASQFSVTGAATSYKGALYTPTFVQDGADWKITSITTKATETTKSVSDTANMLNFAWINTINNLQKRMGDLRGGEASDMAWARFQRNNDDVNVGDKQSLSGNLYQIGYDFLIKSNDVAKNYFGLSFDVFDGSQSYKIGGGDAKSMTLSAYYTKIYESGHYFDFIMRYGRFESDTTSYDSSLEIPELTKLDYAMNGITLSGEYGYRAKLGNGGLYLEPQAEFIYGYLSGAKTTSSTGLLADIDSTNHFVGRLGLAFGQKVKCFNYYLRGSYYHDFAGTSHVKYGVANYKQDGAENWWEVTLGGGWNLSKVSYFYAELTKHFKDISNSLNFNLGFRLTL